jgi:predicted ATPase
MSASIFPPESNASVPTDETAFEPLPGGAMELRQFLKTAIRITSALAQLHAKDTIHRNIRPQNIRMHTPSGYVKLLGQAGAYTVRDPQREAAEAAEALPYMSPEQTEDMKRPADHRSDLYSLGVVFYEMLSGKLPFQAEDPIGWVQAHLTLEPPPLTVVTPETPQAVSDIVGKLLQKTVEERYQSARGLLIDLETCLVELRAKGTIEPFPLGARDVWHGLRISAKLYGRETEAVSLFAAFERVVNTTKPEIALVSGYSGVGKTSVVLALHKPIVRERGFFLSGKFDQHKRNIPYVTIGQAFRDLIRQILTERTSQIELWKKRIAEALGPNAQIVIDIIPQLEELIGKQPPVPELPIADAQNRFNAVFRSFLGVFAKREHPLVLFLDDLQYADWASLALLNAAITHGDTKHILVLGAYRDNEVSPSHPAITTLEEIKKAGVEFTSIVLKPLEIEHLQQLVADTLHCSADQALSLAALLHKKTGGNPFFANQFLAELHHENLVRFDVDNSVWQWDIAEIGAKEFTDDVVELMASKLRRLPGETQAALQLAACIGSEFDVEMLQVTHDKTPEETYQDLDPAVRGEFMLRRGNIYKFMHDRVHQAAYSLIPKEQVNWVHLRIGRLLLERTPQADREERIFDIVNQFNMGKVYITEADEQVTVAGLNLIAGRRAKASVAYRSASTYLGKGISLLPTHKWDTDYELTRDLYLNQAESKYLSGNIKEEEPKDTEETPENVQERPEGAEEALPKKKKKTTFEVAEDLALEEIEHATSNADKADGYSLLIRLYITMGRNEESIARCIECLKLFGIDLPPNPDADLAREELRKLWESMRDLRVEDLLDLPWMTDRETMAAMNTLAVAYVGYFYVNPALTDLAVFHMINLSVKHGNSVFSPVGYASFGRALCANFEAFEDGFRWGKMAYDLTDKYNLIAAKIQVCNFYGALISFWTRHISTDIEISRVGLQAAAQTGNPTYTSFHWLQVIRGAIVRGDPLDEVYHLSVAGLHYSTKSTKFYIIADMILAMQRHAQTMRGLTASFSSYNGDFAGGGYHEGAEVGGYDKDSFDEEAFAKHLATKSVPVINTWFHELRMEARFLSGDYEEAVSAGMTALKTIWGAVSTVPYPELYFHLAICASAHFDSADATRQEEYKLLLAEHEAKLRLWAKSCPENFLCKHALIEAEIARLEGRNDEAAALYDKAAEAARARGFVHNAAMSKELAARFYRGRNDIETASRYIREARDCYAKWQAHGKVKHLAKQYPDLLA